MRPESQYEVGYQRVALASTALFDMQLNHATRCQFPAEELRGKEDGWYLNVGDKEGTTEETFDVASFIGQGR